MPALCIATDLSSEELRSLAKTERDARVARRMLAIANALSGMSREAAARSWNPNCGHCFYCDRNQPILCEPFTRHQPHGRGGDVGRRRLDLDDDSSIASSP